MECLQEFNWWVSIIPTGIWPVMPPGWCKPWNQSSPEHPGFCIFLEFPSFPCPSGFPSRLPRRFSRICGLLCRNTSRAIEWCWCNHHPIFLCMASCDSLSGRNPWIFRRFPAGIEHRVLDLSDPRIAVPNFLHLFADMVIFVQELCGWQYVFQNWNCPDCPLGFHTAGRPS